MTNDAPDLVEVAEAAYRKALRADAMPRECLQAVIDAIRPHIEAAAYARGVGDAAKECDAYANHRRSQSALLGWTVVHARINTAYTLASIIRALTTDATPPSPSQPPSQ